MPEDRNDGDRDDAGTTEENRESPDTPGGRRAAATEDPDADEGKGDGPDGEGDDDSRREGLARHEGEVEDDPGARDRHSGGGQAGEDS